MNRIVAVLLPAVAITLLMINAEAEGQDGRDSEVNPGPTGSQGMIGGRPGSSPGRTPRKRSGQHRIKLGDGDTSNLRIPSSGLERSVPPTFLDNRLRDASELPSPYIGRPGGVTLDESIEIFVRNNLDLLQNREEITQSDADYITAGLRSNPIAYIDTQGVPYGRYTDKTTGGPVQYDLNIVHPWDFSRKRQARMASALISKRVVETKYEDIVRLAIDNLTRPMSMLSWHKETSNSLNSNSVKPKRMTKPRLKLMTRERYTIPQLKTLPFC